MNKHLDKAIFGIGKVDALMHSIEQLYLDFEVMPEEQERLNRGGHMRSTSSGTKSVRWPTNWICFLETAGSSMPSMLPTI